jgi:hypothetical protein
MITPDLKAIFERHFPPMPPLPFHVDCPTLSREMLEHHEFEREFHRRKAWIKQNCAGRHDGEGIRSEDMRLVGRRFKFEHDAVNFRMFFG